MIGNNYNLIGMEKAAGAASTVFVHMPGAVSEVLASLDGSNPAGTAGNYYFHDNLGSVRGFYNGAKTRTGGLEFDPYGVRYAGSTPDWGTGYQYGPYLRDDALAMDYTLYRQYAPSLGRWTSRDPLDMVDGPNLYGYVQGNPCSYVDSLGLFTPTPEGWPPPPRDPSLLDCIVQLEVCRAKCNIIDILVHWWLSKTKGIAEMECWFRYGGDFEKREKCLAEVDANWEKYEEKRRENFWKCWDACDHRFDRCNCGLS